MSFQENRFPIVLGAVTAVAAGGLIWWGMKSGSAYDEAKGRYDDSVGEIERLLRAKVAPTSDNLREKKKAVAEYRTSVASLQTAFDKYRQFDLKKTEVSAFNDALLAGKARVAAKFEEAEVALPPSFFLGLGRYTDKLPNQKNTGLLHYELGAFEDLFGRLAEAKPAELLNVHWPDLPEEMGKTYDFKGKSYRVHPIEITFEGSEDSMRKFLSSLDNSDEYYYVVRTMRVVNTRTTAPNAKDATFEQPAAPADDSNPFGADFGDGGFVFPPGDEEPAAEPEGDPATPAGEGGPAGGAEGLPAEEVPAPPEAPEASGPGGSGQFLKQVLGSEKIRVFLRIDVLQFVQAKELPKN